jgi:hypothetical protein
LKKCFSLLFSFLWRGSFYVDFSPPFPVSKSALR